MKILILNCSPVRIGATGKICSLIAEGLSETHEVKQVCIDDYSFAFCTGCRLCHETGKCVLKEDGADQLAKEMEKAEAIVCVSPSYWADVPGQFKAFIDRMTLYSNTHDPHASLGDSKLGFSAVLRTGSSRKECERLQETISHFYSHLDILSLAGVSMTEVENREDVDKYANELEAFVRTIKNVLAEAVRIRRIAAFEKLYDDLKKAVERNDVSDHTEEIMKKLSAYYETDWKEDFEADESGRIPQKMKRGVLSEDGLYDLLEAYEEQRS